MKKDSRELAISFAIHRANTKSNAAMDTKTALVKNQAKRLISYAALSYSMFVKTNELGIGTRQKNCNIHLIKYYSSKNPQSISTKMFCT